MIETLIPLDLPPGMFKNGTGYQAAGRWNDGSLVRFFEKTTRPVGGWRVAQGPSGAALPALTGVPRRAFSWRDAAGAYRVAIATTDHLFELAGGVVTDITPAGFTPGQHDGFYTPGGANTGAAPLMATLTEPSTWHLDNFGTWLVACATNDGRVLVQTDPTLPPAAPSGSPTNAVGVVVTPERFLVALQPGGLVSWPSQETTDQWTANQNNTAGDFTLATNGRLMCGRRTRGATLLFTDVDLHAMTYIGGQFVYRFDQVGNQCGIVAPNAVALVDSQVFWMSRNAFFTFDGFAKPIPCDVSDYVFGDFNDAQRAKVNAVPNTAFGEIWWYYPSSQAIEPDRYVVYNYRENHWTCGTLSRTAGIDAGVTPFPILCGPDGTIYEHEYGSVRTGATPWLESGPMELGNGDNVVHVQRIVPDERTVGDVQLTLMTSLYPNAPEDVHGPYAVGTPTSVRLTGRQVRLRIDEARPTDWRVGLFRLGVRQGGRR